jgi:hypothetical protein
MVAALDSCYHQCYDVGGRERSFIGLKGYTHTEVQIRVFSIQIHVEGCVIGLLGIKLQRWVKSTLRLSTLNPYR